MNCVIHDWQPRNEVTTPLTGEPTFVNSGIIKAVMTGGEKISVGQIDYQEFDEENFQYVISPYWEIVDALPASVFQGIPGINMDLRLRHYYRVNYTPTFITERTPSKNREDLWELLEAVGLNYYDRFEWLLRSDMRAANDNLIVERRRETPVEVHFDFREDLDLQYGDKVFVKHFSALGDTSKQFSKQIFDFVVSGVNIESEQGTPLVDGTSRQALVSMMVWQRMLEHKEQKERRRVGIEAAKKEGKYQGRKTIEVDELLFSQVAIELENGLISVREAMNRTGIDSRSTFYRKLKNRK